MSTEIKGKGDYSRTPWNKGRLVGQKRPLRPKDVWAIHVRLQIEKRVRDLAMFNLAVDSKLRGCDIVSLRIDDVCTGGHVKDRATIIQRKAGRPVQFEITEQTRASLQNWLAVRPSDHGAFVFPSRVHSQLHLTPRKYPRVAHSWIERAGMDSSAYGINSMRQTKAARSTAGPATFEPLNFCADIRRWKAPFATSASKSMIHWRSRNRSNSEEDARHARLWPRVALNSGMRAPRVRRDKGALSSGCATQPAKRSRRKQPGQA